MTTSDALDQLSVFSPNIPVAALEAIRQSWPEAEPVLLAELDWKLEYPYLEDRSALFLYAFFLCAEMRSAAAFERYLALARLPEMLVDFVLGDMVTESLPQLLARTCHGRFDPLKALVEDRWCGEYARAAALDALEMLVSEGQLSQMEMEAYCLGLLEARLERSGSFIWDAAIALACKLRIQQALPLIRTAYELNWANPSFEDLEHVEAVLFGREPPYHYVRTLEPTEVEMEVYACGWPEDGRPEPSDFTHLLAEPAAARRRERRRTTGEREPGRNDPCPCGSGKKYKKCCIESGYVLREDPATGPVDRTDEWIMAGAYYFRCESTCTALTCWKEAWRGVLAAVPAAVLDPDHPGCNGLFNGYDFLSNWLQDVETAIDALWEDPWAIAFGMEYFPAVLARFPQINEAIRRNFTVSQARLEAACGKAPAAIARLEQLIREVPDSAQGYVELASLHVVGFRSACSLDQALQLLLRAKQHATDGDDWDLDKRIESISGWIAQQD